MKDTRTFIDYLVEQRNYYEEQIDICKKNLERLEPTCLDFKSYKWMITNYEARLDCINDLLGAVKPKD